MGNNEGRIIFLDFVLLLLFIGTIRLAFKLSGRLFLNELFFTLLSLLLVLISLVAAYQKKDWAWPVLFIMFGLITINALYIYQNIRGSFILTALTSLVGLIGFYSCLINLGPKYEFAPLPPFEQYVASEKGKKYHRPECSWAEKINNKVWLTKEEAEKNYKPCDCVTN